MKPLFKSKISHYDLENVIRDFKLHRQKVVKEEYVNNVSENLKIVFYKDKIDFRYTVYFSKNHPLKRSVVTFATIKQK